MRKKEVMIGVGLAMGLLLVGLIFASVHTLQIIGGDLSAPAVSPGTPGSSGGTGYFWIRTYGLAENHIGIFYRDLGSRERIEVQVNNEKHYVGVVNVNSDSAIIQIMSNAMNVSFMVGEEKKFDLNKDKYYDLYIKLNSIINKKANLTIKNIYEKINNENLSVNNASALTNGSSVKEGIVKEDNKSNFVNKNEIPSFLWIGILILLIVLIIITSFLIGRGVHRKRKVRSVKMFY